MLVSLTRQSKPKQVHEPNVQPPVVVAVLVVVVEDPVADPVHSGRQLWVHGVSTHHRLVDTSQAKHRLPANLQLQNTNSKISYIKITKN